MLIKLCFGIQYEEEFIYPCISMFLEEYLSRGSIPLQKQSAVRFN